MVPHITDAIQEWVEKVANQSVSEDGGKPEVIYTYEIILMFDLNLVFIVIFKFLYNIRSVSLNLVEQLEILKGCHL